MTSFIVQLHLAGSDDVATSSSASASLPELGRELPRLGRSSLRDQVALALESRILDGSFSVGERLPTEFELQESFGVSRTVIRDALRTLAVRGLVEIRRGSGTTVMATPADAYSNAVATMLLRSSLTLGEVFDARAALESQLALVSARNHTPELLERVEEAFVRFETAVRNGEDVQTIVTGHVEFHTELLRATNLPALEVLLRPIQELMLATSVAAQGMDPRDPAAWRLGVHRGILEAVASRDEGAVSAACDKHWATPLRGKSYRQTRAVRLGDIVVSPRELVAVPGGAVGDAG